MSLFELPPEPAGAINRTAIYNGGTAPLVIASADLWRSDGTPLFGGGFAIPELVNHGTLWSQGPSAQAIYSLVTAGTGLSNDGVIAAIGVSSATAVAWQPAFLNPGSVTNSGGIYAAATSGYATALVNWDRTPVTNSGIIAARALQDAAIGYQVQYGAPLVNLAAGRIFAEGTSAYAAWIAPTAPTAGNPYALDNAGLIAAAGTTSGHPSIAIYGVGEGFGPTLRVNNTGTIRGDYAFFGTGSDFFRSKSASDIITNGGSGVMDGAIWTDTGADQIINRGAITGAIGMGEGDDLLDTAGGTLGGTVDLGTGNDTFVGGAGGATVFGDRGDDSLTGGSGAELLVGGRGDDVIAGGGGNDGLYGDYGADLLRTLGGDRVSGGGGDDRIELGDYAFAAIDGGDGFDWLVLPGGSRAIDLGTVVASRRLTDIEGIVLSGEKRVTLRADDVLALTGGETSLRLASASSDRIELVGSWTAGADVVLAGTAYRSWSQGGTTVLVSGAGGVTLSASAAAGAGLDPVAPGPAAPVLNGDPSPHATTGEFLSFDDPLQIDADETWTLGNLSYPGLRSSATALLVAPRVTNYGQVTTTTNGTAIAADLVNYGTVLAQDGPASANAGEYAPSDLSYLYMFVYYHGAGAIAASGPVENYGTLKVRTANSGAAGIANAQFYNSGTIDVASELIAVGFQYDFGTSQGAGDFVAGQGDYPVNAGRITVSGKQFAAGAVIHQVAAHFANAGSITATVTDPAGTAAGIVFSGVYSPSSSLIENSGTITAPIAIYSDHSDSPVVLLNRGGITGAIRLDAAVSTGLGTIGYGAGDTIINAGTITGDVRLGVGNDVYDGTGGHQAGAIAGEAGNDLIKGSLDADRIDGGAGDDLIIGSPGGDRLTGGGGHDVFAYATVPGAGETITDFVAGVDKLDLGPLAPTSVRIEGAGNLWQVHVTSAAGNFVIAVQGSITTADLLYAPGLLVGSYGPDVLTGSAQDDVIYPGGGRDTVSGGLGNDILYATGGYDQLDGGGGADLVVVGTARSELLSFVRDSFNRQLIFSNNTDGTIMVRGVEQFRFADGLYSFLLASGGGPVVTNFNPAFGWASQAQYPRHVADMNGDGYADIVGFGTSGVLVSYGRAAGSFAPAALVLADFGQSTGWLSDNQFHRAVADVNGDGRGDLIGFGLAGTLVSLARPDGTFGAAATGLADFGVNQGWASQDGFARLVGDVNGDGKADIVGFGQVGALVALGRGDGTFQTVRTGLANFGVNQGWTSDAAFHRELADVNGDGLADLIGFGVAGTYVALARGDGAFAEARLVLDDFGTAQGWSSNDRYSRLVADVNGDHVGDIVGFGTAGTLVAFGKGDGTFTPAGFDVADFGVNQGWTSDNTFHRELADINRDGLLDIVGFGNAGVLIGFNQADFLI